MGQDYPDISELFAPLVPTQAFGVILSEAQQVLGHVREPVDAELWGSDMIGALARSASGDAVAMREVADALVPAAEEAATCESLALLRIFAAIGSPALRAGRRPGGRPGCRARRAGADLGGRPWPASSLRLLALR